jgi:regulator of protease activity HflC (stomatin/prohibitin superfamily)
MIMEPEAAVVKVENYLQATSLIAQTTLRSVLGQSELDELLAKRDKINATLQEIIDRHTSPWGVKVTAVEVRDVVLPDTMKRAMARQAETERERRAKVINAEGEFQAAEKLCQAAEMIAKQPIALQLRYLQTINEISGDRNTTTIFPIPIDFITPFLKKPTT